MNFESGTKLAKSQDSLISKIKANPDKDYYDKDLLHRLSSNVWVKWAAELAPNNLVVRQWCLEDIVRGIPKNAQKIHSMCYTLAPFPGYLWCEGYSYWRYTAEAIDLYIERFDDMDDRYVHYVKSIKEYIEQAFIRSSYIGIDGLLRPAPFGDLRDIPIIRESRKRSNLIESAFMGKFLEKGRDVYYIRPFYRGMNGHTPSKKRTIRIVNGRPEGFKFYTGYDKKYDNKGKEALDLAKRFFMTSLRGLR